MSEWHQKFLRDEASNEKLDVYIYEVKCLARLEDENNQESWMLNVGDLEDLSGSTPKTNNPTSYASMMVAEGWVYWLMATWVPALRIENGWYLFDELGLSKEPHYKSNLDVHLQFHVDRQEIGSQVKTWDPGIKSAH
ncbi:hypothetical protein Tco_0935028 [Tanacetum coccineum]